MVIKLAIGRIVAPLAVLMAAIVGCVSDDTDDANASSDPIEEIVRPTWLDQWDAKARNTYYWASEGSQIVPQGWFVSLEQAEGNKPFRSAENMARLGYLPQAASPENPDGFPVGFATDVDPDTGAKWVGWTCGACHTSQITYQGHTLRIDGGPGMADATAFVDELIAALAATARDEAKLRRFAAALGRDREPWDVGDLRADIEFVVNKLGARAARNRPQFPPGRGRVDPFGNIINETICGPTNMPQNCRVPNAPLKMPHLWGVHELEWVQANALSHNPLSRNAAQSMGVSATTTLRDECPYPLTGTVAYSTICRFESSLRVKNIVALNDTLHQLEAPVWPAEVLGAIDRGRADRGKEVYAQHCETCHTTTRPLTEPNFWGTRFIPVVIVPLEQIGTDPGMARAVVESRADPGPFIDYFDPAEIDAEGRVSSMHMVAKAVGGALVNALRRELSVLDLANVPAYLDYRSITREQDAELLLAYKARPLAGIAFAGYLLHNGSVPNVYELLLPPSQRSRRFHVGNHAYDPQRLGFVSNVEIENVTTSFDTSLPGNDNSGHEYGTSLADADRWALVEYLKTL